MNYIDDNWATLVEGIKIIDPTQEAREEYGYNQGGRIAKLSEEQVKALLQGKSIAFTDGEYSTFLILEDN